MESNGYCRGSNLILGAENHFDVSFDTPGEAESKKQRAYMRLKSESPEDQELGAMQLIRTHFERSCLAAVLRGDWREHPDFPGYVAMTDDYEGIIPPEIMKTIRNDFGTARHRLPKGKSFWRQDISRDTPTQELE
jgi:hypothetical protein